jgi:hypothetical protein
LPDVEVLGRCSILRLCDELLLLLQALPAGYVFPGAIDGHLSPAYVGKRVCKVPGVG